MNAKELLKLAKEKGWQVKSQRGSHIKLINKEGKTTIIPFHGNKDIPIGTANQILKQLGLK